MPVNLTNIGRERTIAGIVKTLVGAKSDAEVRERAEEALLRANPGLGAEGGLKPGAPIVVPDLRVTRRPPHEPEARPPGESIRILGPALEALARQVGAPLDAALKDAAESAKSLKTKAMADAVGAARPDLKGKLSAITAEVEQEVKRAEEAAVKLRAAVGRMEGLIPTLRPR